MSKNTVRNRKRKSSLRVKAEFLGLNSKGSTKEIQERVRERLYVNGKRVNFPTLLLKENKLKEWRKFCGNPSSYDGYEKALSA